MMLMIRYSGRKTIITVLVVLVVTTATVWSGHNYICRFGGRCTSTIYGPTVHYSGPWKAHQQKLYWPDGTTRTGLVIAHPSHIAPITLGLAPTIPAGRPVSADDPAYAVYSAQLVSAEPEPHIAGVWDVRAVIEGKGPLVHNFNAVELLLSTAAYQSLHLETGKMVAVGEQGIIPDFTAGGRHLMVGTNSQEELADVAAAGRWFEGDAAKEAHAIITRLSVSE